jgi:hypothetical protein
MVIHGLNKKQKLYAGSRIIFLLLFKKSCQEDVNIFKDVKEMRFKLFTLVEIDKLLKFQ